MKLLPKFGVVVFAVCLSCSSVASAAIENLVQNGEFETPVVAAGGFVIVNDALVPGWSSGSGLIEIWSQTHANPLAPQLGSDGLAIGNHMEVNPNGLDTVFQTVVPSNLLSTSVTLNFDAWDRGISTGTYSVTGSVSGSLVAATPIAMNSNSWTLDTQTFNVVSGEMVSISFTAVTGNSANSPHIDQVELNADVIPEPTTLVIWSLLATLGIGVCWRRRRRTV